MTFDIKTPTLYCFGKPKVSTLANGRVIEETFRQDEEGYAADLFGTYFKDRNLRYGPEYYLRKCSEGFVVVCFSTRDEALWFKDKFGGEVL